MEGDGVRSCDTQKGLAHFCTCDKKNSFRLLMDYVTAVLHSHILQGINASGKIERNLPGVPIACVEFR
jgi:hypothetical protein